MDIEPIHEEIYRGYKIKIEFDPDPENPRKTWETFGHMVCWHSRYDLGDENPKDSVNQWREELACELSPNASDAIEHWRNGKGYAYYVNKRVKNPESVCDSRAAEACQKVLDKHTVMLPLYLYDHGGLTMNTSGFTCRWDSGQVGWIYATRETILKEFGGKILTQTLRKKAERILRSEVEEFDTYLTGQVFGFRIYEYDAEEAEEGDEVHSCWGFYEETPEPGLRPSRESHQECLDEAREEVDGIIRLESKAA